MTLSLAKTFHYALAVLLTLAAAPNLYADNIAASPGFEDGIQGWSGYPCLPIERSTEFAHTGKYSLKFPQGESVSNDWGNRWTTTGMQSIPYPVQPGGHYRCAIFARADTASTKPAHISLGVDTIIYDYHKPSVNADIPPDGKWHEVAMEFTNPDFVKYLAVNVGTTGTVWVDDFSIEETAPPAIHPIEVSLDSPVYFDRRTPIEVTATLHNHTGDTRTVTLSGTASLPDAASPATIPLLGYGKPLKTWKAATIVIPANGTMTHKFTIDTQGVPDTGIKIDVDATSGSDTASGTREVFICQRPDWHTWFSIGAQCYTSNRFDGTWVRSLHDIGGDSVRECVPHPMSYRNAIPGQFTDYPLDTRLNYYARYGIKWFSAYHTMIDNAPSWLSEDPSTRITLFDGTARNRPAISYFSPKARAALMQDAEIGARVIKDCPAVFGVQVDNEINAFDSYGPEAQASFRDYVRRDYGTIQAVNAAWKSSYKDFSDIKIPARMYTDYFQEPTGGLDAPQPEPRTSAKDFTWLKWREDAFIAYYRDWTAHFKKIAPNIPVMDNFCLYVSTLPRFYYSAPVNLFRFADFFDVGGVDTGPSFGLDAQYEAYQFDWVNSAWGDRPVWVPEIYYDWKKADPHAVGFDLVYGMGRKVQHTNLFCWPVLADKWGGSYSSNLLPARAYMLNNVKTDIAMARSFNAKVQISSLHYVKPAVGIYWSRDIHDFAIAMHQPEWLPGTDPLYDIDKVFTDLQYPVSFIDEQKLGDARPEKAIFVTGAYALSASKWNEMLAYANRGGVLFLNGNIGAYDEHLQPYASAPCGVDGKIRIALNGWKSASSELFNNIGSPLVKLGKGRKVRGFGQFTSATISPEWHTVLTDASGKPGLIWRTFGNGKIFWSLTDIGNSYATYQTSNTLFLIEGILESAGIGRLVRVMNEAGSAPAPKVTIAVKRRTATEAYVFVNNFGPAGSFRFYINVPLADLVITDMITGSKMTWSANRGCAEIQATLPKCGYAIYRVASVPFDIEHLSVHPIESAPPALAGTNNASPLPVPQTASLTEGKTASGTPLFLLTSPFVRAAFAPERGGRISSLSASDSSVNNVLPMTGIFPPDGIVSGDDGGIKSVLDPDGASFPGITLSSTFTVTSKTSTASAASISSQCRTENMQLDQTVSVSQSDPALRITSSQRPLNGTHKLRLYLHANLLLQGAVSRNITFVAGNNDQSVEMPYQLGQQLARPVAYPTQWGAVVDSEQHTAVLCLLEKGYSHITFWNGMRNYNLEAGSDFADVSATAPQAGQVAFYVCKETRHINFVTKGIAGSFASWPEAGGQSVAVSACSLTAQQQVLNFVVEGIKVNGNEVHELGTLSVTTNPLIGTEKSISLGGSGSGYDSYRLCLKQGDMLIPLKTVAGNGSADAPAVAPTTTVASWPGNKDTVLPHPVQIASTVPWTLDQGTVRVKFKTTAAHDIVHNGIRLVNGYHGAIDYNTNRTSRLWLNIHGLAQWSPSAPMIFLMIYDKDGHHIHVTANATLRDNTWYELTASWNASTKHVALYLDGQLLKIGEQIFPDNWDGAAPIEALEVGDATSSLGVGSAQTTEEKVSGEE